MAERSRARLSIAVEEGRGACCRRGGICQKRRRGWEASSEPTRRSQLLWAGRIFVTHASCPCHLQPRREEAEIAISMTGKIGLYTRLLSTTPHPPSSYALHGFLEPSPTPATVRHVEAEPHHFDIPESSAYAKTLPTIFSILLKDEALLSQQTDDPPESNSTTQSLVQITFQHRAQLPRPCGCRVSLRRGLAALGE